MIRVRDTRYPSTTAFLEDAIRVAQYYGFVSLDELPKMQASELPKGKKLPTIDEVESTVSFARREESALSSVARRAASLRRHPSAALFAWRIAPLPGAVPALSFELHVIGHTSAMAEALLLVVANAIAEEAGMPERSLAVNTIGSVESSGRFVRDVGPYLRQHLDTITPQLRGRVANDPLGALVQLIERGHPGVVRAPQSPEYLTEEERRRFWEFLEYLEVSGMPYELNPHLLGSRDVWAHTLYELSIRESGCDARLPFAFGGRYDALASRFSKRPDAAAMIAIQIESHGAHKSLKPAPQDARGIFFAHLGSEARRSALSVMEVLRRAQIPVHQSFTYDRLGDQMLAAKHLGVPFILILGHKEAAEHSIMVREVATNSQETIPVDELAGYLRRHRMAPALPAAPAHV